MEKKAYIKPSAEVIEMNVTTMIAASLGVSDETIDPGEALSNDRRGTWGNLWADDEKE